MRDRLVALLVGATIAVIALYGVPRAYVLADLVRDQQQHEVQRAVDTLAAALSVQHENGIPVTEGFLTQTLDERESLVLVEADGTSTTVGEVAEPDDSDVVASAQVAGGGRLTLTRPGRLVSDAVADAVMPLVLLGLALLAVSAVGAVLLARRVSRPFQELAAVATELGQGRFDREVPHYSTPEVEAVGNALRRSAAQLDVLVRREREFAVNASHELLTPITGLNLQLEDLRLWPETAPAVAEELGVALETIERLTSTIQGFLAQDRDSRRAGTMEVDLEALTRHAVEEWQRATGHREVTVASSGTIHARVVPEEVSRLLAILLDHTARHVAGPLAVDCAELGTHLRVRVGDAGQATGGGAGAVQHRGLQGALAAGEDVERAAELAEGLGGHLVRDESGSARFVLMLPKPEPSPG